MTHDDPYKLQAMTAALGAGLAPVPLFLTRLDLGLFINQACSVPWNGLAMVAGSNLQRLVS